jgi:hypothetical protein
VQFAAIDLVFLVEKMGAGGLFMKTIFASILVLAACSGDPLDPGAGDDPGGGTNTLEVDGHATAEPRIANARADTDFDTDFEVEVRLNGQVVTTGTVTVRSRFGETALTWSDQDNRWNGRMASYDEVYRLDVVSGNDEVVGVIVDGPDIHVFTNPMPGATLDSTVANALSWNRDERADITTFDADEIDRLTIEDTGDFMMTVGVLRAERDQVRENRLELRRTNHVIPAGAIAGSDFAVSVENRMTVLAAPNPAL